MSSITPEQPPSNPTDAAPAPDMEAVQAQLDALAQQMKAEQTSPPSSDPRMDRLKANLAAATAPGRLDQAMGRTWEVITGSNPQDTWALDAVKGAGQGMFKGIFETSDFLFGEPEPEQKDWLRAGIEQDAAADAGASNTSAFSQSVGQFTLALLGAGKLIKAAEVIPKVGTAIEAAGAAIKSYRGGAMAAEGVKAAAAGAVAFDPHDERLSNLIQSFPALQNPVTEFLAADPKDSAAMGRVKTALESLGLDASLGVLLAGLKTLKGIRSKDYALIDEAEREAFSAPSSDVGPGGENAGTFTGTGGTQPLDASAPVSPSDAGGPSELGGTVPSNESLVGRGDSSNSLGSSAGAIQDTTSAPPSGNAGLDSHPSTQVLDLRASNENGAAPNTTTTVPGVKIGETPNLSAANEAEPPRVEAVQSVSDAQARDAGTVLEPKFKTVGVSEPELQAIEKGLYEDGQSLLEHNNNWLDAVYDGHPFANSAKIPYQKLGTPDAVGNLITDLTDVAKPKLDKGKGGAIMSDRSVAMQTAAMTRMFNENPAEMMALFEARGLDAQRMTATMNTAYRVAARAFSDAYKTLMHVQAGSLLDGMTASQMREFATQQLDVATTALNHANSIKANAARTIRQLRPEFAITAKQLASVRGMNQDLLREMILGTGGDISKMAQIVQKPGLVASVVDFAQYILVNNLLWGYKSHTVNMVTNFGMAGLRPAERALGSVFLGDGTAAKSALMQYIYMGGALSDGWRAFMDTFRMGDSILAPHNTEMLQQASPRPVEAFLKNSTFRPVRGLSDVLYNAAVAGFARTGLFALGLPTRTLGAVDEMVKTIVYRGHVQALARTEGIKMGLEGVALGDYIKGRLSGSIDEFGRAIDVPAKLEAQTSTFSQDLLPGTAGKGVQNFVNSLPATKLILPFVKTPTNVLRMAIKYSPGLNLAQSEYRQMIKGELGKDRQAQAIGQMAVGSLLLGVASYVVSTGRMTGGGPANRQLKAELMAKGWQPYSLIIKNEDGTNTYFPLSRFDPYGMLFGVVADIQDHIEANGEDNPLAGEALAALAIAVTKNISNRTYLRGINDFIDFASDPETKVNQYGGQQAANMVPFSSMLKQVNPDPYMREARSVVDKVMAQVPGLSEHLQPNFDAFGDPKTVRKGLWSGDANDMVDRELLRLGLETGRGITPPASIIDGVDLRDFTLPDGRNAYTAYQQLAGYPPGQKSLKTRIREVMESARYAKADESSDAPGTKIWMLHTVVQKYRQNARHLILRDPTIREAFLKARKAARDALAAQQDGAIPSSQPTNPTGILQQLFSGGGQN